MTFTAVAVLSFLLTLAEIIQKPEGVSIGWALYAVIVLTFLQSLVAIGALLLDRDDPAVILGVLRDPLLRPDEHEREGYVPNVVYSCGGLLHGDQLLLPYGAGDSHVSFGVVDVPALLARLLADGPLDAIDANSAA